MWHKQGLPEDWAPIVSSSATDPVGIEGVYLACPDRCTEDPTRVGQYRLHVHLDLVFDYSLGDNVTSVRFKQPENGLLTITVQNEAGSEMKTFSFKEHEEFSLRNDRIEISRTGFGGGSHSPWGYLWREIHLYKNREGALVVNMNHGFVGGVYFIPMVESVSQWCEYPPMKEGSARKVCPAPQLLEKYKARAKEKEFAEDKKLADKGDPEAQRRIAYMEQFKRAKRAELERNIETARIVLKEDLDLAANGDSEARKRATHLEARIKQLEVELQKLKP